MSYVMDVLDTLNEDSYSQFTNRLLHNPNHRQLSSQMAKHKEQGGASYQLRYVRSGKDVWTGHAWDTTHKHIADENGIDLRHSEQGMIGANDLSSIKAKGLHKWIDSDDYRTVNRSHNERMLASPSLVPAFVHPVTKKMYIGRRGETHNDIIDRHSNEIDSSHKDNPNPYDRGFYNMRDKTFVNKADSGLDSADLMTKIQRMRKLGVESVDLINDKEIRPAFMKYGTESYA